MADMRRIVTAVASLPSLCAVANSPGAFTGLGHETAITQKISRGSHIKPFEVFVARLSSYGYLNVKKLPTLP